MFDGIPNFKITPCTAANFEGGFLTPEEIEEGEMRGQVVEDIKVWVNEGFDLIDFSFPKKLGIDCQTAKSILKRAGLLRTGKLN